MSEELKQLQRDIHKLALLVQAQQSAQNVWNQKHDERSHEVFMVVNDQIAKLFELNETVGKTLGGLRCSEQAVRIDGYDQRARLRDDSIERRVSWLWRIVGGAAVVGFARGVYEYMSK